MNIYFFGKIYTLIKTVEDCCYFENSMIYLFILIKKIEVFAHLPVALRFDRVIFGYYRNVWRKFQEPVRKFFDKVLHIEIVLKLARENVRSLFCLFFFLNFPVI